MLRFQLVVLLAFLLLDNAGLHAQPAARAEPLPQVQAIPTVPDPNELGRKVMHAALHESVWGGPMLCEVRQRVELNGHPMTSFGKYVRGGQGSGKLRMSLQLPAGNQMNSLLQVSNGELLYTMESIGKTTRRTRVDLGKVRERLTITTESLEDPVVAMYLAIGGQAEVLRKMCQRYEWTRVERGQLGTESVWWLTGKLAIGPPPQRAFAEIDSRLFLDNQSALIPTHVILAVGSQEAAFPFWLYQAEQSRTAAVVTPLGYRSDLHIVTEWANPTSLAVNQLTDDLFDAKTTNEAFDEENRLYLPPARSIASLPRNVPR